MSMIAPIIFTHYGDSNYLNYTLNSAKLFNKDKRIILLGDENNAYLGKKLNIEHYHFNEYSSGTEIEQFDNTYKFIAGKLHGRQTWTKFVFRRWFMIYNFIRQQNIEKFWSMDSDNLILTSLSLQEPKFKDYDGTEQCKGSCLNGFINNQQIVKNYIDTINELFSREEYILQQQNEMDQNPRWAFTEMRAYKAFKNKNISKTILLQSIINDETFDECICCHHNDMELYDYEIQGLTKMYRLKKLYGSKDGRLYTFHIPTQKHIRLNTINMSWVHDYLIKRVYRSSLAQLNSKINPGNKQLNLKVMNVKPGFFDKLKSQIAR
jgi:hypothetical protein